jgi:hypothetical protein
LIEKNWEYGKEFLMVFIDYKKAFECGKEKKFVKVKKQELQQTF